MNDKDASQNVDSQPDQKPPKYRIDESWFQREGRSLEFMIESRASGFEVPAAKPNRKRSKSVSKAPTMEQLSKIEGFVNADLPVMEAVFRLLLIHENKPLDVEQISQELAEAGLGVLDARVINPGTLVRMLDRDFHYGIAREED